MSALPSFFAQHQEAVGRALEGLVPASPGPASPVIDAMRYTLLAPSKRVRAVLVLLAAELCGTSARAVAGRVRDRGGARRVAHARRPAEHGQRAAAARPAVGARRVRRGRHDSRGIRSAQRARSAISRRATTPRSPSSWPAVAGRRRRPRRAGRRSGRRRPRDRRRRSTSRRSSAFIAARPACCSAPPRRPAR